jgi:hypothetical protein
VSSNAATRAGAGEVHLMLFIVQSLLVLVEQVLCPSPKTQICQFANKTFLSFWLDEPLAFPPQRDVEPRGGDP